MSSVVGARPRELIKRCGGRLTHSKEFRDPLSASTQAGAGTNVAATFPANHLGTSAGAVDDEPSELLPGTRELVNEIKQKLRAGTVLNNPAIMEMANRALGGSRMQGTFSAKYVYDCLEVAVNGLLLDNDARALMQMSDPKIGLAHLLRPLVQQLPTQTERTQEQQLLQMVRW